MNKKTNIKLFKVIAKLQIKQIVIITNQAKYLHNLNLRTNFVLKRIAYSNSLEIQLKSVKRKDLKRAVNE